MSDSTYPSVAQTTRRYSHSAIPSPKIPQQDDHIPPAGPSSYLASLPLSPLRSNIASLQTALLGYIGEVETAIRTKFNGDAGPEIVVESVRSDSSPPSVDGSSTEDESGFTTALLDSSSGLRNRQTPHASPSPTSSSSGQIPGTSAPEAQISILNQLSTLREDVLAYLPSRLSVPMTVPRAPTLNREWLRSLPSKLRAVDLGLSHPSQTNPNNQNQAQEKGKTKAAITLVNGVDLGAVEGARQKVIELVHALLPSEDWGGWEKLGWEDQEGDTRDYQPGKNLKGGHGKHASTSAVDRHRRRLGGGVVEGEGEETEDEPEFLFPNRTPASAMAIANRRRTVRSKSLGSAGSAGSSWNDYLHNSYGTFGTGSTPWGLGRSVTEPKLSRRLTQSLRKVGDVLDPSVVVDSEEEDEDDEEIEPTSDDAEDVLENPLLTDTKLTKIEAHSGAGITVAEALITSEHGKKLINYDDLPIWWRNNEHIHTGYRFIPMHASTGPIPLIKSAFTMHNETVNIHTHFIPTLLILCIIIPLTLYHSPLPDAHVLDTASLVSYLCAAAACMISSAGWHVLSGCAARKWFEWGACVDYIGISWLIAASFGTVVYNGFYCHPKTVLFYSSTNLCCGLAGSILPFQKWFNERRNKTWRIAFFLTLCAAMIAPMVHIFLSHGWEKGREFTSPFGISILTYVIGLLFYAFHFPESRWPGKFDTWGASHQIWHSAIILAIILHYRAIFVAHAVRYQYSCMSQDSGRPVSEVVEGIWKGLFG